MACDVTLTNFITVYHMRQGNYRYFEYMLHFLVILNKNLWFGVQSIRAILKSLRLCVERRKYPSTIYFIVNNLKILFFEYTQLIVIYSEENGVCLVFLK